MTETAITNMDRPMPRSVPLRAPKLWTVISFVSLGFGPGCGPDFTPQEEIDRLRVLGIRSEVPDSDRRAWPGVIEDAVLTALVTDDALEDPASFEYRWRLCPVAFGSEADFECVFTEAEFEAFILELIENVPIEEAVTIVLEALFEDPSQVDPEAVEAIRAQIEGLLEQAPELIDVDFVLSDTATATFNLRDVIFVEEVAELEDQGLVQGLLELLLERACEQLGTAEFPDFVERPTCDGTFQMRIDLTVCDLPADECTPQSRPSQTDGPPRVVRAVRFFDIIYDLDLVPNPNRNPEAAIMCRTPEPLTGDEQISLRTRPCGNIIEMPPPPALDPDGLEFGATYGLVITDVRVLLDPNGFDLDLDAEVFTKWDPEAEAFTEERQERLIFSWFTTGGDPGRNRSAFDPEQPENSSIDRAATNEWNTPRAIDLTPEEREAIYGLFVVIRDGRGGRAFIQRNTRFVGASSESAP